MVLLSGLCVSSFTVYGICSLHLGRSYQQERVHIDEGLSCGMRRKPLTLKLPVLFYFLISMFSLISLPSCSSNFVSKPFYPEKKNPFNLYTSKLLLTRLNFTWIYLSDFILQTNLGLVQTERNKKTLGTLVEEN